GRARVGPRAVLLEEETPRGAELVLVRVGEDPDPAVREDDRRLDDGPRPRRADVLALGARELALDGAGPRRGGRRGRRLEDAHRPAPALHLAEAAAERERER